MVIRREETMTQGLSLIEKIDLLINEELSIYRKNPKVFSEQTKDKYYQELKTVLEKYNKEYLEDLGINLIRMSFTHQVKQVPDNK
jgi:hypothetical protein